MAELAKVLIRCAEAPNIEVKAQFNPKELQVDKTVSWTASSSHDEDPPVEFKEPQASSLTATLYFDTYETKADVNEKYIKGLQKMVTIEPSLGRPPLVLFVWGKFTYKGVVDSLGLKYTMFLEDGTPCRCEVAFKMRSTTKATVSAKK
jgi:hypothetical protein